MLEIKSQKVTEKSIFHIPSMLGVVIGSSYTVNKCVESQFISLTVQ